jgi:riboflavin kinase/FMN adenylyltransferase
MKFSGVVKKNLGRGRKLGYPTANLKVHDQEKIIPGDGIYAVYVSIKRGMQNEEGTIDEVNSFPVKDAPSKGMMSIGFRPTVDGKKRVLEVNVFDFNAEIYGRTMRVYIKKFLRAEVKFNTLEELVKQIEQDKIESMKVL